MSKARLKICTHLTLKWDDVTMSLDEHERLMLKLMIEKVGKFRKQTGRKVDPTYMIVNYDEPYAPLVQELILACEDMKNRGRFEGYKIKRGYERKQ